MAITNYGELKTAISDHTGESLSGMAADFVTLAQNHLSTHLRYRRMVTVATLSPTAGEFTLPADYQFYRKVVESSSQRRNLEYITPEVSDQIYPSRPAGLGVNFTIVGNLLRVFPTITNDIFLTYYADFAAFSSDGDTDWLLTKSPLLYLRTCQLMAAPYLEDDTEHQRYSMIVDQLINSMNGEGDLAEYANTGITFSGVSP